MYRTVTWLALEQGLDFEDSNLLSHLAQKIEINFKRDDHGNQRVFCSEHDVTRAIRSPEINRLVSQVAAVPGVRQALVKVQQAMAQGLDVVMDGRDAGTVILPDADYKIFLTASVDERARRRMGQQRRLGLTQDLSEIIKDIIRRDEQDISRLDSPLKPASDAIILDCTELNLNQTVDRILELVGKTKIN